MNAFVHDYLAVLRESHEAPCLSLYQPTHRHYPDNQQDLIRFRNLVKALEGSLRQEHDNRRVEALLAPFRGLAADQAFWNHTLDGLAVLGASDLFRVYRLQRPVGELAVVAGSFHTKPLMRIVQSADRFQLLALSRREVKLFEGNRDVLDELEPAQGVPRTITEALGEELTEPYQKVSSYGMGAGGVPMRHGHGSRKDEIDKDTERFFRAVDRAILEYHSRPSGLPLLLAALPEHHAPFREVSHNPYLLAGGIEVNPDALSADSLRERAWRITEPHYLARLAGLVEQFGAAKSRGLATDDLAQAAEAAAGGRIATLLIDADCHVPGRIDSGTGRTEAADLDHPEVDDLLDDLGELVLKKGGAVVVVPAARMPTQSGLAAIYRF